jgi:hypothetical protein
MVCVCPKAEGGDVRCPGDQRSKVGGRGWMSGVKDMGMPRGKGEIRKSELINSFTNHLTFYADLPPRRLKMLKILALLAGVV